MEVQNIRIDLISPSPLNPRKTFDEVALQELASNIEKQGLLQPITVRVAKSEDVTNLETGDVTTIPCSYEIVCGERRFRAVSLLKEKEDKENVAKIKAHRKKSEQFQAISCIVREMTDDEAFEAMITENLQRKDVDPIEEAFAFAQLAEKGRTLEDIALKIGKSTRFVFDRIKLNSLIPELKERVRNGDIPLSGAMILSKLDEDTQKEFHEEEEEQCTTAMIREFVSNSFMELGNAPWIKDDSDNWENTDTDGAIDRLKEMVNKPFLYQNEEVVILNYCDGTGDDGTEVEIYLNNGKVLVFSMFDLASKLNRFRPITNTVVVLANERLNKVSTVNPTILQDLRNLVLQQIKDVKEDPSKVSQAKQVFQGVNTVINLAKTELEYRKYLDTTDPQNK